jgi:hypothetical protein
MLPRSCSLWAALLGVALSAASLEAAALTDSLQKGTPALKSIGAIAFGPEGILFAGDTAGSAIFAIDTEDRPSAPLTGTIKIEGIDEKIAAMAGTSPKQIQIKSIAVNPLSGSAYLSVMRGQGAEAAALVFRVDRTGKLEEFRLRDVKFAMAPLGKAPTNPKQRGDAITHIEYVKGRVLVAGLSNEEFASRFRAIPFPFSAGDASAGVEIWHAAHNRFETASPVRTFVPYDIAGETYILAAYTCTPLVKIPVSELKPGAKVKGTTVAELGNQNRPLDMVAYEKDGKNYFLMANSNRGVMKISVDNLDKAAGITEAVRNGGKAGLPYETLSNWKNSVQNLAKLDKANALFLVKTPTGSMNLETVALP